MAYRQKGRSQGLRISSEKLQEALDALALANERMALQDMRRDEFLDAIAHELRTPLTTIRALTEILQDNPDLSEEEQSGFLETIAKETQRLGRQIDRAIASDNY